MSAFCNSLTHAVSWHRHWSAAD